MDLWLIVGSALYWASVGFRYLGPVSAYPVEWGLWAPMAKYLFLMAVIAIAYATMRCLGVRQGRRVLSLAVLGATCLLETGSVAGFWGEARVLCMALEFFVIGSFMLLWGLAFASFDKRRAAQNVIATIVLAVLMLVVGLTVSTEVSLAGIAYGCFGLSSLVVLTGRVPCASHGRERICGQERHKAISIIQRVVFGVALVFCSEIGHQDAIGVSNQVLLLFAVVVLIASLVLAIRSADSLYTALPALLLVAVGGLYLPYLETGLDGAVWETAGIVWIAWSSFSAVQLSDLKGRFGMSELDICLMDKLLLAIGFLMGGILWGVFASLWGASALTGRTGELCIFAITMALVLGSAYAMARLVGERQEDAVRDELARTREERLRGVYEQIAGEFGFSRREREVMEMLAKGYTSVYICEELGVSAGTAKAHTAHIYQKLGIHRKDELLALIDERMADA